MTKLPRHLATAKRQSMPPNYRVRQDEEGQFHVLRGGHPIKGNAFLTREDAHEAAWADWSSD